MLMVLVYRVDFVDAYGCSSYNVFYDYSCSLYNCLIVGHMYGQAFDYVYISSIDISLSFFWEA